MTTSVETVQQLLESVGFQILPKPLVVAGSAFDFDAAIAGTGSSHDLVVVGGHESSPQRLVQLLAGLNRTLDQLESRRPVSLILIGARPEGELLARLEESARVLVIDSDEPTTEDVELAVAVLLPLRIPKPTDSGASLVEELLLRLPDSNVDERHRIIDASSRGTDAVRLALRDFIDEALENVDTEQEFDE